MLTSLPPEFLKVTKEKNRRSFVRGGVLYVFIDCGVLPRMTAPGDAVYEIHYVVARRRGESQIIGMLYSNAANITELANGLFNGPVKLYPDNRFVSIYAEGIDGTIDEVINELIDRGTDILASVAARIRPVSEVEKGI